MIALWIFIRKSCVFFRNRRDIELTITFCPQEATAEEVEFDDEEAPEEVEDNKDYWVLWTEYCVHYDGCSTYELFMLYVDLYWILKFLNSYCIYWIANDLCR